MPSVAVENSYTGDNIKTKIVNARTTAGNYVLLVDCANMTSITDILEIWIELKVLSTSASSLYKYVTYSYPQNELVKISIPVPVVHELTVYIKAPDTNSIVYPWSLVAL